VCEPAGVEADGGHFVAFVVEEAEEARGEADGEEGRGDPLLCVFVCV
jgi:hypothetical protein